MLIITMFVMGMFLACGPTDGENDGGDSGDSETVVFSEDFESGNLDAYTITDGVATGSTNSYWKIAELTNTNVAEVDAYYGIKNDSRLEFTPVDLTSYTTVTLDFTFRLHHYWCIGNPNANGGDNVKEGGYDMKVMVKEGTGEWTEICHEDTFTGFDGNGAPFKSIPHSVDLSAYAGKKDVTVAFWVIGEDCATASIDDVKIKGE